MNPLRKAGDYRHQHISKGWMGVHAFRKGWPKKEARIERAYRHSVNLILRSDAADFDSLASKCSAVARQRVSKDSVSLPERIRKRLRRKVKTEYDGYINGWWKAEFSKSDLIDKLFSLANATSLYAAAVSFYLDELGLSPLPSVGPVPEMKFREMIASDVDLMKRLAAWRKRASDQFPDVYGPKAIKAMALNRNPN